MAALSLINECLTRPIHNGANKSADGEYKERRDSLVTNETQQEVVQAEAYASAKAWHRKELLLFLLAASILLTRFLNPCVRVISSFGEVSAGAVADTRRHFTTLL